MKPKYKCNILLDSGAFSAWRRGIDLPLKDYIAYCKAHKDEVDCYVAMDCIPGENGLMDHSQSSIDKSAAKSYDNTQEMKAAGLSPVPVFHQGENFKWLDKMLEDGETYIGISPYMRSHQSEIIAWMDKCFTRITDKYGKPLIKTHGFGVTACNLCTRYPWHCMTPDHEVLTRSGWKFYTELKVRDVILCFDKGIAKWQRIKAIPVFDVVDVSMTEFNSSTISACVTDNHRWQVKHLTKKIWQWKTTETLNTDDMIPRVAQHYEAPKKTIPDYLVELMAWFWTEGTIKKPQTKNGYSTVGIYQSLSANPEKVEMIRSALKKAKEAHCETVSKTVRLSGKSAIDISFELYGEARHFLLKTAPNKVIPLDFIWKLTKEQIELFVKISVLADGTRAWLKRKECFSLVQAKFDNIEMFRIACLLAGHANSLEAKKFCVNSSSVDWIYPKTNAKITKKMYTGKIWCVQVPSGAFFVKRDKRIYVTGNSVDSTSWSVGGGYGSILVPEYANGIPDYSRTPLTLRMSARKQDQSRGFDGLPEAQQEVVRQHAAYIGVAMSELRNTFLGRWRFNVKYFLGMAAACDGKLFKNQVNSMFGSFAPDGKGYQPKPLKMYFATVLHTMHHNKFLNEYDIQNRLLSYAFLRELPDDFLIKYRTTGLPEFNEPRTRKMSTKTLNSEAYRVRRVNAIRERLARPAE